MNRRDLVQKIVVGGTVLLFVPAVLESCTKNPATDPVLKNPGGASGEITIDLSLAANAALNSSGNSKIIQNVIVINAGGTFKALSSICTHQGCTVGFDSPSGNIKCPCHGSQFTTSGSIVNGPAAMPLQSFPVSQTGNVLTITT
jgi:cytochrome b6-f complex iron-sulfur subunit